MIIKKNKINSFLIIFFIFFFGIILQIEMIAESQEVNILQQEERLKEVEKRKMSIQAEIDKLKQEKIDYNNSLEQIEKLYNDAERELKEAQKSYSNTIKEIEKLEEELEIEQNKLDLQLIILKNRLNKFYKHSSASYLSVLFESKDFAQFLNRYRYLECILENDFDIIKQVDEQVEFVRKQKESLQNKKDIITMLEKEISKEKENIQMSLDAKNKYIIKIEQEQKKQLSILEELEKSSAQIKNIIETAYKEKEKIRQIEEQKKSAVDSPVKKDPALQAKKGIFELPVKGTILANYGEQKQADLNAFVFNSGIDINASLGDPVKAASFGIVIYTGNVKGYGDIIIVDHGGNVVTLYAHLSKIIVKLNDQVSKGQIIGQVGKSGGVPSPRLHFEIRVEGKPVDPFEWL